MMSTIKYKISSIFAESFRYLQFFTKLMIKNRTPDLYSYYLYIFVSKQLMQLMYKHYKKKRSENNTRGCEMILFCFLICQSYVLFTYLLEIHQNIFQLYILGISLFHIFRNIEWLVNIFGHKSWHRWMDSSTPPTPRSSPPPTSCVKGETPHKSLISLVEINSINLVIKKKNKEKITDLVLLF